MRARITMNGRWAGTDLVGGGHRRLNREAGHSPAEVLVRLLARLGGGEVEGLAQSFERVGDVGRRLLDQFGQDDLTLLDQGDKQIVLAFEMPVENPHRHARFARDVLHRQLFRVEPPHQAGGGVDQLPGLPHRLVGGRPERPPENSGMPLRQGRRTPRRGRRVVCLLGASGLSPGRLRHRQTCTEGDGRLLGDGLVGVGWAPRPWWA